MEIYQFLLSPYPFMIILTGCTIFMGFLMILSTICQALEKREQVEE